MKKVVKKPVAKKPVKKAAPKKVVKKVVKKAAPKPKPAPKKAPVRKPTPTKPKPKPTAAPRVSSARKNIKKIAGVKSITGRRSEANKGAFGGATTRAFSSTGQFAARGKSFSWTPAGVSIKKDGTRAVIKKKPYA